MAKSTLIAITGTDGSGKSTLIENLKQQLLSRGETVAAVSIWDGLFQNQDSLGLDPKKIDLYLSHLTIEARSHFLMHALWQALALAQAKHTHYLLLDSYWYKYLAAEEARAKESQNAFNVRELGNAFEKPNYVFWVETPIEVCASRKSRFSGYETNYKGLSSESFIAFQNLVTPIHRNLANEASAIVLDGNLSPEKLLRSCLEHL